MRKNLPHICLENQCGKPYWPFKFAALSRKAGNSARIADSHLPDGFSGSEMRLKLGQVAEWLKAHAWKACIRDKRIGGSNPPLSARIPGWLFPINGG